MSNTIVPSAVHVAAAYGPIGMGQSCCSNRQKFIDCVVVIEKAKKRNFEQDHHLFKLNYIMEKLVK